MQESANVDISNKASEILLKYYPEQWTTEDAADQPYAEPSSADLGFSISEAAGGSSASSSWLAASPQPQQLFASPSHASDAALAAQQLMHLAVAAPAPLSFNFSGLFN